MTGGMNGDGGQSPGPGDGATHYSYSDSPPGPLPASRPAPDGEAPARPAAPPCPDCRGSGLVVLLSSSRPCAKCGGTGTATAASAAGFAAAPAAAPNSSLAPPAPDRTAAGVRPGSPAVGAGGDEPGGTSPRQGDGIMREGAATEYDRGGRAAPVTGAICHYDAADRLVRVTVEDAAGPRVTVDRDEAGDCPGADGNGQ